MFPAPSHLLNNSTTISPTLPPNSPIHELSIKPSTLPFDSTTQVRKSTRSTRPPSYLKDYHCHMALGSVFSSFHPYSISKHLSYDSLSLAHKHFVLSVSPHFEPQFYHQAIKFPKWRVAMEKELSAMEANHTWIMVPLPPNKHSTGCKWIFKLKYNSDGSVARHKACLVAKGYTQQEGIDFIETFSLVAKLVTVKLLLALAACQNWTLAQLDVNNAFLNGDLFEEVYMDLPLGYHG